MFNAITLHEVPESPLGLVDVMIPNPNPLGVPLGNAASYGWELETFNRGLPLALQYSVNLINTVKQCLCDDPNDRPNLDQLLAQIQPYLGPHNYPANQDDNSLRNWINVHSIVVVPPSRPAQDIINVSPFL